MDRRRYDPSLWVVTPKVKDGRSRRKSVTEVTLSESVFYLSTWTRVRGVTREERRESRPTLDERWRVLWSHVEYCEWDKKPEEEVGYTWETVRRLINDSGVRRKENHSVSTGFSGDRNKWTLDFIESINKVFSIKLRKKLLRIGPWLLHGGDFHGSFSTSL